MLRKILKDNSIFFIPYLILLLFLSPFLFSYSKGDIHFFINQYHSGFSDISFALLTYLGDGLFIIVPVIVLLFVSLRHAIFMLTAYLSTGLVTQILKRVFFEDMLRPSKFLEGMGTLRIVDGVELLSGRSFPSGHATSAFAFFLGLALIIRNRYLKLACFLLACLVAFSRVYLSQHFLIDITIGSLIGSIGTLAIYLAFYQGERTWYSWRIQKLFNHEQQA
jgi:membrane-associated phospholipid phosphatase